MPRNGRWKKKIDVAVRPGCAKNVKLECYYSGQSGGKRAACSAAASRNDPRICMHTGRGLMSSSGGRSTRKLHRRREPVQILRAAALIKLARVHAEISPCVPLRAKTNNPRTAPIVGMAVSGWFPRPVCGHCILQPRLISRAENSYACMSLTASSAIVLPAFLPWGRKSCDCKSDSISRKRGMEISGKEFLPVTRG